MNYIWFSDERPMLEQLPYPFRHAAILFNPFILMPAGWTNAKKMGGDKHIYPDLAESLEQGKPIPWKRVMQDTGISSYAELAIALKTSIMAFRKEFARPDLAAMLNSRLDTELYYPREDNISEFFAMDMLDILSSKGAAILTYSDPILGSAGELAIEQVTALEISTLAPSEIIIADEHLNYAFLSVFDSFITVFLTREKEVEEIINQKQWEAIVCGPGTHINWYFDDQRGG